MISSQRRVAPTDSQKVRNKTMKANKDMLHEEFRKIWGKDEHMTNYCTNKAVTMAILPDGGIVVVEKQRIEKDFCFGERCGRRLERSAHRPDQPGLLPP